MRTLAGIGLFVVGLIVALHLLRIENAVRHHRQLREMRAHWLARSALARARYEVDGRLDLVGEVGVDVLSSMTCPAVSFDGGRAVGFYKVLELTVRHDNAKRTVVVKGEGVVEGRPIVETERVRVVQEERF